MTKIKKRFIVKGELTFEEVYMKAVRFFALLLMVIGALNWGLVGFFKFDIVSAIFGGMTSMGARVVFAIVGLAGLVGIGSLCRCCKSSCKSCKCGPGCNCCKKD